MSSTPSLVSMTTSGASPGARAMQEIESFDVVMIEVSVRGVKIIRIRS